MLRMLQLSQLLMIEVMNKRTLYWVSLWRVRIDVVDMSMLVQRQASCTILRIVDVVWHIEIKVSA